MTLLSETWQIATRIFSFMAPTLQNVTSSIDIFHKHTNALDLGDGMGEHF